MDETQKKELQEVLAELKDGITVDVVEKLKKELPLRKGIFGGENAKAEGVEEQKANSAEFVKSMFSRDFARAKELGGFLQTKGMSEGTSADGGYLVPTYFSDEIVRVANNYGVVRQEARRWPMKGLKQDVPTSGGIAVYRVNEGAKGTSVKPTISHTVLTAKKLVAMIPVSNELLEDADLDVVNLLSLLAAEGFAGEEDTWGILGLGSGEGIFQNTSVPVQQMGSTFTTFAGATFDDLLAMQNQLKSKALGGARYVMHNTVLNNFRGKKDSQGRYLLGDPTSAQLPSIFGLPVSITDAMPAMSATAISTKFVALANFNYMLFGDRKQITMEISREATLTDTDGSTQINAFEQDMSVVKFVERIDIELAEPDKAFTSLKTAAS